VCVSTENWEIATIAEFPLRAIYRVDIAIYLTIRAICISL